MRYPLAITLIILCFGTHADAEILAEYRFEGGPEDTSGFGFHGELVGDASIQDGRLFLPGGLDNSMSLDLGEFNPFGGQNDWTLSFEFQTQEESLGPLFSSDGAPFEEPWPADQSGSLNIFFGESGAVLTDFWFIDAIESFDIYNDDEPHTYVGTYDSVTGDYLQIIDGEDEAFGTFLLEATGEPIDRDATGDRTFLGDESNPDFGFEFNLDGFHGFFDNLVIETEGELPDVQIPGDFDGDGQLGLADVNLLNMQIAGGPGDARFDLNADAAVNDADLSVWVKDLKKTWFGDANLDGVFNTTDFVDVFQRGKFEQDVDAAWEDGDWSGDLRFNTTDFVIAFQDGGFEMGPVAAQSVPEPTSLLLLMLAAGFSCCFRSTRRL